MQKEHKSFFDFLRRNSNNSKANNHPDDASAASGSTMGTDQGGGKPSQIYCSIRLQYEITGVMFWKQILNVLQGRGLKQIFDHRVAKDCPNKGYCMEELFVQLTKPMDESKEVFMAGIQTALEQIIPHPASAKVHVEEWHPTPKASPSSAAAEDTAVTAPRRRPRRLKMRSTPAGFGRGGLFQENLDDIDEVPDIDDAPVSTSSTTSSAAWGVPATITLDDGTVYKIRIARDSLHQLKHGGDSNASNDFHGFPLFRNGRRVFEIFATHDHSADDHDVKSSNSKDGLETSQRLQGFVRK